MKKIIFAKWKVAESDTPRIMKMLPELAEKTRSEEGAISYAIYIAGKNISSFTNDEEENYAKADVPFELETALTKQGAIFHKTEPWQPFSIADGNLVTGQNPASARGAAEKMIKLLEAA